MNIKKINISLYDEKMWKCFHKNGSKVYIRGYFHNTTVDRIYKKTLSLKKNQILDWIASLDGHFAIIVLRPSFCFIAVDKIRSYPIIYSLKGNQLSISDNGSKIQKLLKLSIENIDLNLSKTFALSGFSFDDKTIYKCVKQINPGNLVIVKQEKLQIIPYFTWKPWIINKVRNNYLKDLKALNNRIIKKLIKSANGKQIIIPLSGGLDSRFLAAGLKKHGYNNVICVSYGIEGNKEVKIAKEVCKKLEYKWLYIKYTSKLFKEAFYSKDYIKYLNYCDNFTAIHFPGEYLMLKNLKKNKMIDENAIIVNGQTGDFISGNHIPLSLHNTNFRKNNIASRLELLTKEYINKHYKHWKSIMNDDNKEIIKSYISMALKKMGGFSQNWENDFGTIEYLEFINRQSKYVINGQRNYEYFGFGWRLPFWDDDYLKFWETVPLRYKINQNLYKKSLHDNNWCNVWKNIKINPYIIAPAWIIPVRFLAKIIFFPFGKESWHKFERKYLDYFMTNTCCYGPWNYFQIIADKRGHFNPTGWIIEHYLNNKGLDWRGKVK